MIEISAKHKHWKTNKIYALGLFGAIGWHDLDVIVFTAFDDHDLGKQVGQLECVYVENQGWTFVWRGPCGLAFAYKDETKFINIIELDDDIRVSDGMFFIADEAQIIVGDFFDYNGKKSEQVKWGQGGDWPGACLIT